MLNPEPFSLEALRLDCKKEAEGIVSRLRHLVSRVFHRRGVVVALSGGIDSSVVAALSVHALGKERVFGLLMPERDSSPETLRLSQLMADSLGIERHHEDITPVLEAVGCYRWRHDAIRRVIPEFTDDSKCKIVLPSVLADDRLRVFSVVVELPDGRQIRKRLSAQAYLEIVAASNFKQRIRKMFEYFHADRLNYAVTGTPNRQEYDQGFFVKLGDGAADVKPIAHLYKTQVYQMAEYLGVPEEIRKRPPTTDTYSLPQSQEEFYFSVPYEKMDCCLYGLNHGVAPAEVGALIGLTSEQVERVYDDIQNKRNTTRYLHMSPVLLGDVPEIRREGWRHIRKGNEAIHGCSTCELPERSNTNERKGLK
ncbi:MAG: NAD(+) synthase [Sedimentisphaerales bacterium]|nr:NAD(+) synthase [Sedimentisphaerales bacterium]